MFRILSLAAFIGFFVYTAWKLKRDLHMMQQNSYRNERYLKWFRGSPGKHVRLRDLVPALALVPAALDYPVIAASLWLFIYVLLFVWREKVREKKKLVMTKRAARLYAVALALALVIAAGAGHVYFNGFGGVYGRFLIMLVLVPLNIFSFVIMLFANRLLAPLEQANNNRYFRDAQRIVRQMPSLTVIGVTGSFGKTSTKHILSRILSEKFNVLMTPGSFNTPMGVTKVIRTMLKPIHEMLVIEMGAKQKGDIAELCRLVSPRYGILTAIGEQHLETFKSLENIKNTKFELIEALPADGLAFFNLDDPNIWDLVPRSPVKSITYGIDHQDADYSAREIKLTPRGTGFILRTCQGEEVPFQTKLLGRHNIYNILAAVAAACELGMDLCDVARAVQDVEPVPHRLALKRTPGNITIIDDAFNANPVGSQMALEALAAIPGGQKIIVTPGMIELGEKQYEINKEFAVNAAKVCDYIILVGRKHTKPLQDGLKSVQMPRERFYVARDLADANRHLQTLVRPGDVVLFENDLPDTYNE